MKVTSSKQFHRQFIGRGNGTVSLVPRQATPPAFRSVGIQCQKPAPVPPPTPVPTSVIEPEWLNEDGTVKIRRKRQAA